MEQRYVVRLTESARAELEHLIAAGTAPARKLMHARILLKADRGPNGPGWVDTAIAEAVEVSQPTIARVRRKFVEEGVTAALNRRAPRRAYRRKLDGAQEAHLIALACSTPPEGRGRWSLRLLADRMVELEHAEEISYQTVRRLLKKTSSSPGCASSG
jgi:transposase